MARTIGSNGGECGSQGRPGMQMTTMGGQQTIHTSLPNQDQVENILLSFDTKKVAANVGSAEDKSVRKS